MGWRAKVADRAIFRYNDQDKWSPKRIAGLVGVRTGAPNSRRGEDRHSKANPYGLYLRWTAREAQPMLRFTRGNKKRGIAAGVKLVGIRKAGAQLGISWGRYLEQGRQARRATPADAPKPAFWSAIRETRARIGQIVIAGYRQAIGAYKRP
jgi:hypothetical protein